MISRNFSCYLSLLFDVYLRISLALECFSISTFMSCKGLFELRI
jgi:hypothetical protein